MFELSTVYCLQELPSGVRAKYCLLSSGAAVRCSSYVLFIVFRSCRPVFELSTVYCLQELPSGVRANYCLLSSGVAVRCSS